MWLINGELSLRTGSGCSTGLWDWLVDQFNSLCALLSWRSCKQKKALSKARATELGTSLEGEKLQSDSGVFLDSHSLQDNQTSKGTWNKGSLKRLQTMF